MSNLVSSNDIYGVTEKNSVPVVSSRKVAEVFNKRHDNVLADIKTISDDLLKSGQVEFWLLNFQESTYKMRGKRYLEYLMTKDGFTFLVMGYRGKKASAFKVAYINRFNQMEDFIKSLHQAKMEFPAFTAAIMMSHEEPKHYHFSNEINMINRIVLGMDATQFKKANGIESKVASIRPYLSLEQIKGIEMLQRVDIGLQVSVPDFQERKRLLTEYYRKSRSPRLVSATGTEGR